MLHINAIGYSIKTISTPRISKAVCCECCAVRSAIVSVAALIVGVAAEGPVAHEAILQVGGKVEARRGGCTGVEVLDFLCGEGAVVDGDVVY